MGQSTYLRTLTQKSVMKFGKYSDITVKNLLDLNKTTYLRWCYYNCSEITFTEDILELIRIPPDFRIEKPSKCPDKHDELNIILWGKISPWKKFRQESHRRRVRKGKVMGATYSRIYKNKRGYLQSKNHGH